MTATCMLVIVPLLLWLCVESIPLFLIFMAMIPLGIVTYFSYSTILAVVAQVGPLNILFVFIAIALFAGHLAHKKSSTKKE